MQRYFVNMLHFSNMNCEFMNMVYQENCKDLVSIIQQPKKKTRKQTNKTSNQGILFLDRKQTTFLKKFSYSQLFLCYNFLFLYLLLAFYMRSLFKFLYSLSNCQYICGMFFVCFCYGIFHMAHVQLSLSHMNEHMIIDNSK